MKNSLSDAELEAYLDDELDAAAMARMEEQLRQDPNLGQRLAEISGRREAGLHALGAIWRRHRASCPTREQLGSFLLEALEPEWQDYVQFHLETIGCRYCQANLADLQQHQQPAPQAQQRQRRYFESSVGRLRRP